jgi:hypothetical protein
MIHYCLENDIITLDDIKYVNGDLAVGAYESGYFSAGSIDGSYNSTTPVQAQDNGKWYTYASGQSTAASGPYSNGYYTAGEIDLSINASHITQDTSSCTLFTNGVAGEPGSGTCE